MNSHAKVHSSRRTLIPFLVGISFGLSLALTGTNTLANFIVTNSFQDGAGGYAGTQDATLRGDSPTALTGSDTDMSTGQELLNKERFIVIRFDSIFGNGAGQISNVATIVSAKLTLTNYFRDAAGDSQPLRASPMLVSWDESTVNFRDRISPGVAYWAGGIGSGPIAGSDYDHTIFSSATTPGSGSYGTMTWDITPVLQSWFNGSLVNNGLILYDQQNVADSRIFFRTSEFGTISERPLLTVIADIPEPSALVLAACAGLWFVGRKQIRG